MPQRRQRRDPRRLIAHALLAERVLSVPVLVAALLVIPVIVIEQSAARGPLVTLANVLNWLIWIVLAVELAAELRAICERLELIERRAARR